VSRREQDELEAQLATQAQPVQLYQSDADAISEMCELISTHPKRIHPDCTTGLGVTDFFAVCDGDTARYVQATREMIESCSAFQVRMRPAFVHGRWAWRIRFITT
jgi:hypothetical protein